MTMEFTAEPEQLGGVKVGDRVDFEIDWDGKVGRITRISAQNPAVE
ncbi:copper-binding protein [Erythrobacter donghaensis]|nr:copper-binding protein [Erythrobacter donghaensis]